MQWVPSRFGYSHSVFYVTKGTEHVCPPEMPFSYSQQITSVPLVHQIWELSFWQCHAAGGKPQPSVERNRTFWPCEARGQMLPEILGSVQCVISGQIIEIAMENPHHKGQKTSCWISAYRRLQSDWNAPFGSLSFLRALGNVLRMVESFLAFFERRNAAFFSSSQFICAFSQKICVFKRSLRKYWHTW